MEKLDMNRQEVTLIFLHVPKTAGTILNSIFNQRYKRAEIHEIYEPEQKEKKDNFPKLSLEERASIKLLRGHDVVGLHEYLPGSSTYITVLRNPIERIISHYYQVLRNPNTDLQKIVVSKNLSLEEYVSSGILEELDNGQVRLLSNMHPDFGNCSLEMLQQAKDNIKEHFFLVGTQEKFDEFLLLLAKKLNWQGFPFYLKQNVASNRQAYESISSAALKVIEKYNELDLALYEFVQQEFNELYNSFENKVDLIIFKLLNATYKQAKSVKDKIKSFKLTKY
jgi:hypothetical protein